jgi:hypothetical protein
MKKAKEGVKIELDKLYVGYGTKEHFGPLEHKGKKGGSKSKVSGHVNPWDFKESSGNKSK